MLPLTVRVVLHLLPPPPIRRARSLISRAGKHGVKSPAGSRSFNRTRRFRGHWRQRVIASPPTSHRPPRPTVIDLSTRTPQGLMRHAPNSNAHTLLLCSYAALMATCFVYALQHCRRMFPLNGPCPWAWGRGGVGAWWPIMSPTPSLWPVMIGSRGTSDKCMSY